MIDNPLPSDAFFSIAQVTVIQVMIVEFTQNIDILPSKNVQFLMHCRHASGKGIWYAGSLIANENTLREARQEGFYVIGFENHLMRFREPEGLEAGVF